MKKNKGFTLIEFAICIIIILVVFSGLMSMFINNMGATENRAYEAGELFISKNQIVMTDGTERGRMTCAGDSDADGYGSCTIVTLAGEKIYLQCPTDWIAVNFWNAASCKEIEAALYMRGLGR